MELHMSTENYQSLHRDYFTLEVKYLKLSLPQASLSIHMWYGNIWGRLRYIIYHTTVINNKGIWLLQNLDCSQTFRTCSKRFHHTLSCHTRFQVILSWVNEPKNTSLPFPESNICPQKIVHMFTTRFEYKVPPFFHMAYIQDNFDQQH